MQANSTNRYGGISYRKPGVSQHVKVSDSDGDDNLYRFDVDDQYFTRQECEGLLVEDLSRLNGDRAGELTVIKTWLASAGQSFHVNLHSMLQEWGDTGLSRKEEVASTVVNEYLLRKAREVHSTINKEFHLYPLGLQQLYKTYLTYGIDTAVEYINLKFLIKQACKTGIERTKLELKEAISATTAAPEAAARKKRLAYKCLRLLTIVCIDPRLECSEHNLAAAGMYCFSLDVDEQRQASNQSYAKAVSMFEDLKGACHTEHELASFEGGRSRSPSEVSAVESLSL